LPLVQQVYEDLAGRDDVLILAINSGDDSRDEVARFWEEFGLGFTAVVDPPDARGRLAAALGARLFPTNIVVGPDGIVRHSGVGFDERAVRRMLGL
jgi:hypothetical protein